MIRKLSVIATIVSLISNVALSSPNLGTRGQAFDSESALYEPEGVFFLLSDLDVTTPSRTKTTLRKAPGTVTVITDKDIERMGATSIMDALRFIPEVTLRTATMGQEFGIRSFGRTPFTERVLLLIDGAPYNSPDKGGFPTLPMYDLFPISAVKQIEIISGPGSAMYGANAFWGVMNIVTKKGKDLANGSSFSYKAGARNTIQPEIALGNSTQARDLFLATSFKQEKGPVDWLKDSTMKYQNLYTNWQQGSLSASYFWHHDDSTPAPWTQTTFNLGTHQVIHIGDVTFNKDITEDLNVSTKLFYNRRKGNTCKSCHGTKALPEELNERRLVNLQARYRFLSHKTATGIEFDEDKITKDDDIVKPDPNTKLSTFAIYAEDQAGFFSDRLITTIGGRFDNNEKFSDTFSPRIHLVYLANDNLVLRGGYSQAFRKPTWNELYLDSVIKGNPGLNNETIKQYEFGAEYKLSPKLISKLDLYSNRLNKHIYYFFGQTGTSNITNDTGHIHVYGGELKLSWYPSNKISGFLGYAMDRFNFNQSAILPNFPTYAPENKLTGGLFLAPWRRTTFDTTFSYYDQALAPNPASVAGAQSVALINTRISYTIPFSTSRLKFVLAGNNLLNRKINQHQSGGFTTFRKAIWPGREFFTQISWEF